MYVLGHVGISLLLYAPLAWLLLSTGQPAVAALTGLLMIVLAPLPDLDTYTDRLDHRGPTHTVWFALGVGLVTALVAGVSAVAGGAIVGSSHHYHRFGWLVGSARCRRSRCWAIWPEICSRRWVSGRFARSQRGTIQQS